MFFFGFGLRAGIFKESIGARKRNRVIVPARQLLRLAEFIPWN
jgi:hypothetical protein